MSLTGLAKLSSLVFLFRYLFGDLPVQQLLVVEKQRVVVHRPPFPTGAMPNTLIFATFDWSR